MPLARSPGPGPSDQTPLKIDQNSPLGPKEIYRDTMMMVMVELKAMMMEMEMILETCLPISGVPPDCRQEIS